MARLPPLLPTSPATLRDTDADESLSPKRHRHRHLESSPRPESSRSRRLREPSPPPSSRRRAGRSPSPPPSKDRRRARSPPYVSTTQRPAEPQRAKRPSAGEAVDGREEGDMAGPSPLDEAPVGNRPSHRHGTFKQVETVPAPVVKVERDEQNMDSGKVDGRSLKGCEAVSDENELAEEVNRLKSEIETVSQDRDYQSAQAQSLMADVAKQKEVARIYGVELEDAMRRVAALEEEGLLQRDTIQTLQIQIASANEKLTVPSST